jgi:hypothetical protein
MGYGEALELLLVLAAVVAAIWVVTRNSRIEREADWFRYQYEARVTGPGFELIKRYLRRTRAWRIVGAVIGVGVAVALGFLGRKPDLIVGLFIGWFIAGLVAELATKLPGSDRRGASLAPRRVGQFLPPFAKRVLVVAVSSSWAVAAVATVVAAVPTARRIGHARLPMEIPVSGIALSIALATMSLTGLRRLTYKPFPVSEPEIDAAEAAIRMAASVRIAAGWAALQFIITVWLATAGRLAARPPLTWLFNVISLMGIAGVIVAWTYVPTRVIRKRAPAVQAT